MRIVTFFTLVFAFLVAGIALAGTDMNCVNRCTAAGNMTQLCFSRCSWDEPQTQIQQAPSWTPVDYSEIARGNREAEHKREMQRLEQRRMELQIQELEERARQRQGQ